MRKLVATMGLLALTATAAQAQRGQAPLWQTELGIRGGFTWFQATGLGHEGRFDLVDLPGADILNAFQTYGTLFAVLPWKPKVAIEPSLSVYQSNPQALLGTTLMSGVSLGLRADYAFTPRIYAAAGGALNYADRAGGNSEKQLGLVAAVGYRHHLTGALNGRAEVQVAFFKKASNFVPYNLYSLLLGVSAGAGSNAARPAARPGRPQSWPLSLGITAGYSSSHVNGSTDVTVFAFPGNGSAGGTGITTPTPPSMFVTIPVGEKLGVEVGWDIHRLKTYGAFPQTIVTASLAPRLNYAFNRRWYVAAGGSTHWLQAGTSSNSIKWVAQSGAQVGAGYRFALIGAVGGRLEANYAMFKRRQTTFFLTDYNTFSLLLGASMGLK